MAAADAAQCVSAAVRRDLLCGVEVAPAASSCSCSACGGEAGDLLFLHARHALCPACVEARVLAPLHRAIFITRSWRGAASLPCPLAGCACAVTWPSVLAICRRVRGGGAPVSDMEHALARTWLARVPCAVKPAVPPCDTCGAHFLLRLPAAAERVLAPWRRAVDVADATVADATVADATAHDASTAAWRALGAVQLALLAGCEDALARAVCGVCGAAMAWCAVGSRFAPCPLELLKPLEPLTPAQLTLEAWVVG